MPLPFTRGDILAESNEQKRPPRRAAAARACADAGVIGVYCVGCDPWVRVCAPVAAERGRRAETVFRRVFIGRREQAVFGKGAGRNAVVLFPRAGYRVFAGLCVHRHCGGTARVCVPGVSSIVLAVLLCALARAGELSVAAGAVRHPASGVLPCTLLLGNASLDKSRVLLSLSLGGGGRGRAVSYGSAYWYRFGICCVCLLFAALLELWLVPQFLLLAAS